MAGRAGESGTDVDAGASMPTAATTVVQVAVGEAHTLALSASGRVYTWGRGQFGRMGLGVFQDELVPTQVEIIPMGVEPDDAGSEGTRESDWDPAERSRITQLSAGAYHSLALSGDGTVWSWGFNAYGQLGRDGAASFPAPVSFPRPSSFSFDDRRKNKNHRDSQTPDFRSTKVVVAAAGGMMSSAIDQDGGLWLWGAVPEPSAGVQITDTDAYQKSDGFQLANIDKPGRVLALRDQRVRRVACGTEHILALVEGRHGHGVECYAWGSNSFGQLGLGDFEVRDMPTVVTGVPAMSSSTVVDFACGAFHSIVVTTKAGGGEEAESDSSSSMARNWLGPGHSTDDKFRGRGTAEESVASPRAPSRGYSYNGRNPSSYGTDGSARGYSQGSMPTRTVSHEGRALASRDTGRFSTCWTFGQGENGQLGHGTCVNSHSPTAVEALPTGERILTASCGLFHTAVVMESGDVWVWGMEGGLGMCPGIGPPGSRSGDALKPVRVFGESSAKCNPITGAKGIACGAAHTVTVSNGGMDLWAWGRGKNGVLGLGHLSDSWFPSPVVWPPGSQFDSEVDTYPDVRKSSSRASSRGGSRGRGDEIRPYVRAEESDSKAPRSNSYGRLPEQYAEDRPSRAGYSSLRSGLESPGGSSRHGEPPSRPSRRAGEQTLRDDSPRRDSRDRGMQASTRTSRRGDNFWPPVAPSEPENPRGSFSGSALQSEDVASLKTELTECRRYAESLHAAVYGGIESFPLAPPRSNDHDPRISARKSMYDSYGNNSLGNGNGSSAAAALQSWQQRVEQAPAEELMKVEQFYKDMRNRLKDVLFQRRMEDWCRRSMSGRSSTSSYQQAESPPVRDLYSAQSTPYHDGPSEHALRMSGIRGDRGDRGEMLPQAALATTPAELRIQFMRRR